MKRGTGAWQETHYGPGCKGPTTVIAFCGTRIVVHRATAPAFLALAAVIARHGYPVRKADTAAKVCRTITGGVRLSNHAYGTAVDVNWRTNPYGPRLVTDMPMAMIHDIEELRTRGGVQLFRWGGRYSLMKDAMHFEVMATPAEIAAGIVDPAAAPVKAPTTPERGWLMALSDKDQEQVRDDVHFIRSWIEDGVPGFGVPPARESLAQVHWEVLGIPGAGGKPSLRQKMTDLRDSLARLIRGQQAGGPKVDPDPRA